MNEKDITKKPEEDVGDVAHTMVKAGLSAIPAVGGPVAEIFAAVVTPPIVKRRDEWMEAISKHLKALEGKVDGFKIENLSQNRVFITTLMQATQAAIRNHQEDKTDALRNAVLNAAMPNPPDDDLQLMFLNFVDSFTQWHIRVLVFFDNPSAWAQEKSIKFPESQSTSLSRLLEHAFTELNGRRDFYDQIAKDLFSRGLLASESLHGTMTIQGALGSRTTPMGKQFIKFITSPKA